MALTVNDIKAAFPELARAGDPLIGAKLADAERYVSLSFAGDLPMRDQAVSYWTAHLISLHPGGEFARLDVKKGSDGARTLYERQFLEYVQMVSGSPMVI